MINQFPLDLYMLHKLIRNFFYLIGLSTNRIFLKASVPREEEKEKGKKEKKRKKLPLMEDHGNNL